LKDNNSNRKGSASALSIIHKKKQNRINNNKNLKQILILSFDALKERKARSALTILMVIVGGGLMIAINGMSAGQSAFVSKQLSTLAPNILTVSSGQHGFRGGASGPPTIIFNSEVVNRIKSLPYVQQVIPEYQGQLQLNAMGNIENAQVMGMDPTKLNLISPSLQLVPGSSIQSNNPTGMLVGDSVANPPGLTTPFVTVGQTVKATYSFADSTTGKLQTASRSFIVTGVIEPTGNNQVDKAVVINEDTAN
jgi:putative ABC transport system permease protein